MPTIAEILTSTELLWPVAGAEPWDAPGLVSGDPAASVDRVLLTVDVVSDVVDEAVDGSFQLVLAHHPLLLRGVTSVAEDRYKGSLVARLIRAGCGLVTAHTNADVVTDGVSDVFARALGLVDARPLVPENGTSGLGRVGDLPTVTTLGELARRLGDLLPPTAGGIRVAGDYRRAVQRVSLCGGAGDAFLREPAVLGSDVYVTSDLRHHPASEFLEQAKLSGGPALIDVSHWAAEWLWLETAAGQLSTAFPGLEVVVSDLRTDPWDFVVVQ
ncbi:Nif3-like dinuclear metal center hexameric protein [Humibacter ginsenosidimutans]|uniref:GTP cyclohydrolase 1 type 2 homolog n=1 Tax=Humibacter ginsenosidimutans TaxID=2599293 RepID=A0A5B8M2E3_9MICO|nr:Nif3-like dinuclear metal center hexameric protein [Humibacter ginsenosidimutans]QDZ13902.1 Nif3-like dinuclear metal center hexameric protein [Humibacter ginsenosidimutans]